jgi:uncharacterized protein
VLSVRVQVRAARAEFVPVADRLRVRICAPPVDGAANAALIAFMAERFALAPARVALVRGASGREKVLKISAPRHIPQELSEHLARTTLAAAPRVRARVREKGRKS